MKALRYPGLLSLAIWLAACAGMPHGDPRPEHGQGGYAEWRWPYQDPGETWADQLPHPDKVPTAFRTAQVRLQHMREGCAWLLFPAYVSAAQTQYNKSLRAFAAEFYDDSFVDLRALNNQLDEIDRRLEIAGAAGGCSKPRNRYCDGQNRESCMSPSCSGSTAGGCASTGETGCVQCGYVGPEFNCASGASGLRKPGCGCANQPCGKAVAAPCAGGQCPRGAGYAASGDLSTAPQSSGVPQGYQPLQNLYLKAQFPYDSDEVLPEYRVYLNNLAGQLHDAQFPRLHIQGHASSEGSSAHNNDLALRRASSVKRILANQGIPPAAMIVSSYGASQPVESNATAAGRAANRRVEIYVEATASTQINIQNRTLNSAPAAIAIPSTEPVLRQGTQ